MAGLAIAQWAKGCRQSGANLSFELSAAINAVIAQLSVPEASAPLFAELHGQQKHMKSLASAILGQYIRAGWDAKVRLIFASQHIWI